MSVQNTLSVWSALGKTLPARIPDRLALWGVPLLGIALVWFFLPFTVKILYLVLVYRIVRVEQVLIHDLRTDVLGLKPTPAGLRALIFAIAPALGLLLLGIFILGYAIWWPSASAVHILLGLLAVLVLAR